jgi:phage gp46-like protein
VPTTLALRPDPATFEGDLADAVDLFGLETEALIALWTDARVDPSELPEGVPNRGYWGDSLIAARSSTGSRLWLLETAVADDSAARRAEAYALEALEHLTRERRARSIRPEATVEGDAIYLRVRITALTGAELELGPARINGAV